MRTLLSRSLWAALLAVGGLGLFAPATFAQPIEEVELAPLERADDVCCQKGRRNWLTSNRDCRRAGGRVVSRRACRASSGEGRRIEELAPLERADGICCKKGRRDWRTSRRDCRRAGGRVVADRVCRRGPDDRRGRVCCKKGRRDGFTTARDCRRAGGRIVADRVCRRGPDDRGPRVCCKTGRRDFRLMWSRDCRRADGREVEMRACAPGQGQGHGGHPR